MQTIKMLTKRAEKLLESVKLKSSILGATDETFDLDTNEMY